jgi:hypothetical protein
MPVNQKLENLARTIKEFAKNYIQPPAPERLDEPTIMFIAKFAKPSEWQKNHRIVFGTTLIYLFQLACYEEVWRYHNNKLNEFIEKLIRQVNAIHKECSNEIKGILSDYLSKLGLLTSLAIKYVRDIKTLSQQFNKLVLATGKTAPQDNNSKIISTLSVYIERESLTLRHAAKYFNPNFALSSSDAKLLSVLLGYLDLTVTGVDTGNQLAALFLKSNPIPEINLQIIIESLLSEKIASKFIDNIAVNPAISIKELQPLIHELNILTATATPACQYLAIESYFISVREIYKILEKLILKIKLTGVAEEALPYFFLTRAIRDSAWQINSQLITTIDFMQEVAGQALMANFENEYLSQSLGEVVQTLGFLYTTIAASFAVSVVKQTRCVEKYVLCWECGKNSQPPERRRAVTLPFGMIQEDIISRARVLTLGHIQSNTQAIALEISEIFILYLSFISKRLNNAVLGRECIPALNEDQFHLAYKLAIDKAIRPLKKELIDFQNITQQEKHTKVKNRFIEQMRFVIGHSTIFHQWFMQHDRPIIKDFLIPLCEGRPIADRYLLYPPIKTE